MVQIDLVTEFIDSYKSLQVDDAMQEVQRAQYKIEILRSLEERKREIKPEHDFNLKEEYGLIYSSIKNSTAISEEAKLQLRLDLLRQVSYANQIM